MAVPFEKKIAKKWPRNTKRASDNYEEILKLVKENPMKLAGEAQEKWAAKLKEFIESGKWAKIMKAIPAEYWRKIIEEVGKAHFEDAIDLKAFKVKDFAKAWADTYGPELKKIRAMPEGTLRERKKRMESNLDKLIELKGKWRK